ncbi:MAG TPA: ABC transporter permease [Candidatus Acetothermia bacterium]|nr:ABC transporter permease [Candidatus Acetothermia bacterium]
MITYVFRRLLSLIVSCFLISVLVFVVMHVIPGDPAQIMLGTEASPATLSALRVQLGLDRPIYVQYGAWARGILTGDLGESLRYHVPILGLISSRLVVTVPLAILAMLIAVVIGLPAGLYAATRRGAPGDYGVIALSQAGLSIPSFWLGILLMLVFSLKLRWLPAGGFVPWSKSVAGALQSLLLPAAALGLIRAAVVARLGRSSLLEVLGRDYIRTARGKGVREIVVLWKHALRNSLIPIVTVLGMQFASLLAGAIIIENVFYLPGLGRLAFQAIGQRDLPVVQDIVVLVAVLVVGMNLIVDLAYALLDPRIRLE